MRKLKERWEVASRSFGAGPDGDATGFAETLNDFFVEFEEDYPARRNQAGDTIGRLDPAGREAGRPHSTVHRVLQRAGCSRRAAAEREAVVRYEWPCPGQLLHMEVKKFARFTEPGHKTTGNRAQRSRRVGWEYVHSVVDDYSRLAYSEILEDERAETVTAFTRRALDFYLEHGIIAERLMTDNHMSYRCSHSFARLLTSRQIQHLRTRPYTPRTNGKVEHFQQTLARE